MLILVLGGARSGKSAVAEQLARELPPPVTYLATLVADDADDELVQRISAHRARRPSSWQTVNADKDLAAQLRDLSGTVLLDSIGPWVAAFRPDEAAVTDLCDTLSGRTADTVVVSDEVGLSVHPTTEAGLAFRDDLGAMNAAVAAAATHTLFVVAGRIITTAALDVAKLLAGGE